MKELLRVVVVGFVIVGFFGVGFAEKLTPAEKMTKCLPDGTIGFVGGSGMDSIGPAFDKSALGKVLGNDQVGAIFKSLWPQAMAAAEKEIGDPEKIKAIKLFIELARIVCRRPFVAGVTENPAGGDIPVSGFVIIDAGPVRKELMKVVKAIEKLDTDDQIIKKLIGPCRMKAVKVCDNQYAYWGFAGRKFVIAIADNDGLVLKNIFWPSKDIAKGLNKIPRAGDALIINYDFQAIQSLIEKCLGKSQPKEYAKIKVLFEDLGIAEMGDITARVGFSGAEVIAGEAVEIPAPRKGIFSAYGNVDMAIFDLVEPGAMKAGAMNIDFVKFCKIYFGAIKKAIPENELKHLIDGIAGIEKMTNVDIRKGIIESISGEGVFYTIPAGAMMDSPSGGFVAIAGLNNDGAAFEKSMGALGQFAAGKTGGMLQISTMDKGDVTIHAWTVMPLAMMQIMPCWAIVDEQVVFASNMVLCGKAIDRMKSYDPSKGSLTSTEAFKSAVKGLPDELTSLVYTDSKVQFKQITMQVQRVWPILTMGAMQKGIKLPAMLGNFDEALEGLVPSASYSWFDKDGAYSRYKGSGVEVGAAAVGGAFGAAVLMPALGKAKAKAKNVVSASNLRQIGLSCIMYAEDNDGKLPVSLDDPKLLEYLGDSSHKVLVSPSLPKGFAGPSYIYVAGQDNSMNPDNIIIYENTVYLCSSTEVVHLDGHVEHLKAACFIKKLGETYKRLGKDMPEIKFLKQIIDEKNHKKVPIKPETLQVSPDHKHRHDEEDHKFHQQMKESHEKVKKQLEEKEHEHHHPEKHPNPKPVKPKKITGNEVAVITGAS